MGKSRKRLTEKVDKLPFIVLNSFTSWKAEKSYSYDFPRSVFIHFILHYLIKICSFAKRFYYPIYLCVFGEAVLRWFLTSSQQNWMGNKTVVFRLFNTFQPVFLFSLNSNLSWKQPRPALLTFRCWNNYWKKADPENSD